MELYDDDDGISGRGFGGRGGGVGGFRGLGGGGGFRGLGGGWKGLGGGFRGLGGGWKGLGGGFRGLGGGFRGLGGGGGWKGLGGGGGGGWKGNLYGYNKLNYARPSNVTIASPYYYDYNNYLSYSAPYSGPYYYPPNIYNTWPYPLSYLTDTNPVIINTTVPSTEPVTVSQSPNTVDLRVINNTSDTLDFIVYRATRQTFTVPARSDILVPVYVNETFNFGIRDSAGRGPEFNTMKDECQISQTRVQNSPEVLNSGSIRFCDWNQYQVVLNNLVLTITKS